MWFVVLAIQKADAGGFQVESLPGYLKDTLLLNKYVRGLGKQLNGRILEALGSILNITHTHKSIS